MESTTSPTKRHQPLPKRQDILNAKSTRPRGSRLHEYRDLSGELKQTMRQLKGEDL